MRAWLPRPTPPRAGAEAEEDGTRKRNSCRALFIRESSVSAVGDQYWSLGLTGLVLEVLCRAKIFDVCAARWRFPSVGVWRRNDRQLEICENSTQYTGCCNACGREPGSGGHLGIAP